MKWLAVGAVFCVAVDIAKVEAGLRVVPAWFHLIHFQLGTLGLRE